MSHPPLSDSRYRSNRLRYPKEPLVLVPPTLSELTGPVYPYGEIAPTDSDLTRQHAGEPQGERIIVAGRVVDEEGRPVPRTLVEIWQANAAGRYVHQGDRHRAPIDPNFTGAGRTVTDDEGRWRFVTVMPGRYPWPNHHNAWRPSHIHFSLFGQNFLSRLVTQMYFEGDPMQRHDPIFNAVPDEAARQRLVARLDMDLTEPDWAVGFRFDIVLRGPRATPFE